MAKQAIRSIIQRSQEALTSKRRKERLKIYALALEDRFSQIEYCLHTLKSLSGGFIDATSTGVNINFDINKKAEFFCDTFWTWMYSAFDILAQIVNQAEQLRIDEKKVSFDSVLKEIASSTIPVLPILQKIGKSNFMAWVKGYRNCANHRRPICVWHETSSISRTRSYETSSGPIQRIVRYICDHKVTLKPNERRKKDLIQTCEKAFMWLNECIIKVLNKLLGEVLL